MDKKKKFLGFTKDEIDEMVRSWIDIAPKKQDDQDLQIAMYPRYPPSSNVPMMKA